MARRFVFAACCVSLVWACTLFNPLDEYGPPVPKAEASTEAAADAGPDQGCGSRWPRRPDKDDQPGTLEPLVFAMDRVALSADPDAGMPQLEGFDLDGVCTCPDPPSCVAPAGTEVACDADGGVDRAGSALLETIAQLGEANGDLSATFRSGEKNILVRVRNYNGGLDDTVVEVGVYLSRGTEGSQTGKPKLPAFDGNDSWTVDPSSLAGGAAPPYVPVVVDTNAYVSGGTLVAQVSVPLRISKVELEINSGVLTAKLLRDGASYRLDGILVGRLAATDFLTHLDTIRDPFGDGGLCGTSVLYQDLKKKICASLDLAADPNQDGRSAPCDALGIAMLFTAAPAKLGAVFGEPADGRKCGATWKDDCPR